MFRTVQEHIPGISERSGAFGDDQEERGGLGEGAMAPSAGGGSGVWSEDDCVTESKTESAAGACVLWSTVGVGCLIRGYPKSSVSDAHGYCREAFGTHDLHDRWSVVARVFLSSSFKMNRGWSDHACGMARLP